MTTLERNVIDAAGRSWRTLQARAEQLGSKVGAIYAEWWAQDTWGGRVASVERARAAAAAFLGELERGDVFDLAPNFLSGESADDPRETEIVRNVLSFSDFDQIDLTSAAANDLLVAWLDAAQEAFFSTLERSARAVVTE